MTDLLKIRARESDPAVSEHAQQVSDRIIGRVDMQRVEVYGQMARRMPKPPGKVEMVRRMAAELASAARDLVPCSRGCSACCHMPTHVIAEEAAVIAAETGAQLAEPAHWFDGREVGHHYEGVPCTFLVDGLCSIYLNRPFACRIHIHIDRDNTLCEVVPGEPIRVPRLDTRRFDSYYVQAFGPAADARLADIRDFFPKGLAR
jgi:Fe-S-cluster containining protein